MASWTDPKDAQYLGKPIARLDGPAKVTGDAVYTEDVQRPGLLHGAVLRSPYAHARLKAIDTKPAERMPGVKAAWVVVKPGTTLRYQGQEVAAVAADTEDHARDALGAIQVTWEVLPHTVRTEVAAQEGEGKADRKRSGDIEAALGGGAAKVSAQYEVAVRLHSCLEPHCAVAEWSGDEATMWVSTQAVHPTQKSVAANLGIPTGKLRILCDVMGGGFGSKLSPWPPAMIAAQLAKRAKAPVKVVTERHAEQLATGNGPDAYADVEASADTEGTLRGIRARAFGTQGYSERWSMPFPFIYEAGSLDVEMRGVRTNCGPHAPLRAPMRPQACAITEAVIDELAWKLGVDPLEMRLKNMGDTRQDAVRADQFRRGAELIGWSKRAKTAGAGSGRYRRGLGVAGTRWDVPGEPGARCEVLIHDDGMIDVRVGTQDIGTGTRTWVAAVVAEELGRPLETVRPLIGDTNYGWAPSSGGSRTVPSVAPAVKKAAMAAREELFEKVAPLLKARARDLEMAGGRIQVQGDSSRGMAFAEAVSRIGSGGVSATGTYDRALSEKGVAGAQLAEVEVDTWTGRIQPIKVVALQDCGYVLDPLTTESQIIGGVIQGIGMALLEERVMDETTGRCCNPNLESYKIPGTMEMPEIVPVVFRTHDEVSGIGEPPVIPTAAAIANAVYHATGARVRQWPMTPGRVLEVLP